MTQLIPNGKQQFTDLIGRPLLGGRVYFYQVGTQTPKDTYKDVAKTVLNTNPVILDARGSASIYGSGAYRQVLRDAFGGLIWDQVIPDSSAEFFEEISNSTDPSKGGALIGRGTVSVLSVQDLASQVQREDLTFIVRGYYSGSFIGGGIFYWSPSTPKAGHNGGTVISPTVPYGFGISQYLAGFGETNPSGAGCFIRKTEYLAPAFFGATGKGIESDSASIEKCIYVSSKTGVAISDLGGQTYLVDRDLVVDRTGDGPVVMDWKGSTIKFVNSQLSVGSERSISDRLIITTSLTTPIVRGATRFNVANSGGATSGDLVVIESPALTSGAVNQICCYLVQNIDGGNTVYVSGQLVVDQNQSQISATGQTGGISVSFYRLDKGLRFENLNSTIKDDLGVKNALNFFFQDDMVVNQCVVDGHSRGGVQVQFGGASVISKCTFKKYGYVEADQGYVNSPTSPSGLSFGYGLALRRSFLTTVSDCIGLDGWHLSDCARGQTYAVHSGCVAAKNSFGFATHEGSWNITWDNCHAYGGAGFDATRCAYPTVKNCTVNGVNGVASGHGITYRAGCSVVNILNNVIDMGGASSTASRAIWRGGVERPLAGVVSTNQPQTLNVSGNTILGQWGCMLGFGSGEETTISRNTFAGGAYISSMYLDKVTIFANNTFSGKNPAQHTIVITDGNYGDICSLNISYHVDMCTSSTPLNSAHVFLQTTLAHTIKFNSCESLNQDCLIRVQNAINIKSVISCVARRGVFTTSGAAAVVSNAINNATSSPFAVAPITVTNSVNNASFV